MTANTLNWRNWTRHPLRQAANQLVHGFTALTHNGMALTGLTLVLCTLLLVARPDLRASAEDRLLGWLMQRQSASQSLGLEPLAEPNAIERVTAADPDDLPKAQAHVAQWLSRKYRVAPEPLSALVTEAYDIGRKVRLDPTLILAVMAIESRFNPFAASPVGAQGLMQVMTRVHTDKYESFGGQLAAFDPVTNLRVGVQVLLECIQRAGSIEGGLRQYVGAVSTDGNDYVDKVMAEHQRLKQVAKGMRVPVQATATATAKVTPPSATSRPATTPALEAEARTSDAERPARS